MRSCFRILKLQFKTMQEHYGVYNAKTQSKSRQMVIAIAAIKAFHDRFTLAHWDTGAAIANLDYRARFAGKEIYLNTTVSRRKFYCVIDQIAQSLEKQIWIGQYRLHRHHDAGKLDIFFLSKRRKQLQNLLNQIGYINRNEPRLPLSILNFGNTQQSSKTS